MPKPQPRQQPPQTDTAGQQQTTDTGAQPGAQGEVKTGETETAADEMPDIFSKKKKKVVVDQPEAIVVEEDLVDISVKDIVVETDLFTATFTNKGAGLKSFVLKKYNDDTKKPLDLISSKVAEKFGGKKGHEVYPFYFSPFEDTEVLRDINRQRFLYTGSTVVTAPANPREPSVIRFQYADALKKIKVEKTFTIYNNSYVIGIDYDVIIDGKRETENTPVIFGPDLENNVSDKRVMQAGLRAAGFTGDDVDDEVFAGVETRSFSETETQTVEQASGQLPRSYYWAAYDTTYFAAIFKTNSKHRQVRYEVVKVKKKTKEKKPELYSYLILTRPESVYMGPKDERILADLEEQYKYYGANEVVDYGWSFFGAIAKLMLKGILLIQGVVPNVGWALVFFTIFIKILLFPLTYASSVSMAKMQTLQPKLKAIKKKYKNQKDPEQRRQMNVETMALYKSEKVNPAGGCLPLLLQMPILFAFFRLLPISINFRHEPWMLWIQDLSIKDPIYALPILMGVTQIIVSKMSPTSADASQKKIMYIMPAVMVFLFMNYSAGLNLYWFIANLLQIVQQYFINKKIFKEKKEEDRDRKAQKRKKGGKAK
jgi:YidC/Oxa1 family membrane protein insertase